MARDVVRRGVMLLAVLVVLWALWEGFKWLGETTGLKIGTFEVNDLTFPHLHDIVGQLFEPSRRNGPLLIEVLGRRDALHRDARPSQASSSAPRSAS